MYALIAPFLLLVALWFLQAQRSGIHQGGRELLRPLDTLPFVGNGIRFLQARHKLLDWFTECERTFGFKTYEISVPTLPPGVVVNDPRNVEHLLKNHEIFIKGRLFRSRSWDLFGNGIINADGHLWKVQRKAGLRFFSNANLKTFIDDVLPPLLYQTQQTLDMAAETDAEVDLEAILLELTTRLMGKVAYDMDMHSALPFSKSFDYASGAIGTRFQNPFWKVEEFFWGAPLRRAVAEVKRFGSAIVATAVEKRSRTDVLKRKPNAQGTQVLRANLIDALLDHITDRGVVADAAMNYLSAGRDTTAQSLTWTFYMLMRHPHMWAKILEELQSIFPNSGSHITVHYDQVNANALAYTFAIFTETTRLYPPVPIEIKECIRDSTFPDGTFLPKNAFVMWIPWAMGRSKRIWGDDAQDFKPGRWLAQYQAGSSTFLPKSAYEFPVFNGGPRSCLGKRMAEMLGVSVIASLVWRYKFEEVGAIGGGSMGERRSQNSLTLPMEGGLPCRVILRE